MPEWSCHCGSDTLYLITKKNDKELYQCNICKRLIIQDNFTSSLSHFIPEKDLLEFGYIFNPEQAKIELEKQK